ncbi:Uncharacterized protein Rs2_40242 [Raphanus sativus]|nr:Uncharacterized protein Rs2_40242 [Raphanus sativus]
MAGQEQRPRNHLSVLEVFGHAKTLSFSIAFSKQTHLSKNPSFHYWLQRHHSQLDRSACNDNTVSESSFTAGEKLCEVVKVFVLLHQLKIFSLGRPLPDQPPIHPPTDRSETSRATTTGLDLTVPRPGTEVKLETKQGREEKEGASLKGRLKRRIERSARLRSRSSHSFRVFPFSLRLRFLEVWVYSNRHLSCFERDSAMPGRCVLFLGH